VKRRKLKQAVDQMIPTPAQVELVEEAAYYLEHSQLTDAVERQSSKVAIIKQQFISGVVTGLVAAVGLAIILSLAAMLLGTVGTHLGGGIGDFARDTSQTLKDRGNK